MSAHTIRRATVQEIDALVQMWLLMMREHQAFDPKIRLSDHAEESYREFLQGHMVDRNALVLTALIEEQPVGFALAMKCRNLPMFEPALFGYVSDMVVLPPHRSQAIGSALMDRCSKWFREQGLSIAQLQVYHDNEGGQRFWRRCGFTDYVARLWLDL